ncbi:MAG: ABC transporter substrate-binding protein [Desulfobacteraceae bacterium]|jgi:glutaredoxin
MKKIIVSAGIFLLIFLNGISLAHEQKKVIMVGDRLVDVAYNLGIIPSAMSVRCSLWSMCKEMQAAVPVLGCPNCLFKKKAKPLLDYAQKHGISLVLIEKSVRFCDYAPDIHLEELEPIIKKNNIEVRYVDFTKGLSEAVKQTASILDCPDLADKVISEYEKALNKTMEKMKGKKYPEKVVIIKGTYQAATGKTFLQVEVPGGYIDKFILSGMGSRNVGDILSGNKKATKGHVTFRKFDGLVKAAPDAIIITGDIASVQKAIANAVKNNKAIADVPAIKDMKVFGLPAYIDANVIEYPMILGKWTNTLGE